MRFFNAWAAWTFVWAHAAKSLCSGHGDGNVEHISEFAVEVRSGMTALDDELVRPAVLAKIVARVD